LDHGSNASRIVVAIVVVALLALLGFIIFKMYRMFAADQDRDGEVTIPQVVNLSEQEARGVLEGLGLKVEVEYGNNDQVAANSVYKQNPKATMHRRPGSAVTIFVSKGKGRYVVPELAGKNVDDAVRLLSESGFLLGVLKKVYNPDLPPGQIVSQQPQPGQEFLEAPAVDLLISDNQQTDIGPMPNLVGQPLADAERLLARSGLKLTGVNLVANDSSPGGSVLKQSISADTPAKLGQQVQLDVALPTASVQLHDKRLQVQVVIPEGPAQQQVRIKVIDELGENVVCDETAAPQATVSRAVDVEGPAKIVIYIRDMKTPWRTDEIPYTAPAPWTPPAQDVPPLGGQGGAAPPPGATF
jgi:beta-lactam-binding protein with PASTA domain